MGKISEKKINEVKRAYANAEVYMLSRIKNEMIRDQSRDIMDWRREKEAKMKNIKKAIEKEFSRVTNRVEKDLEEVIAKAYVKGNNKTLLELAEYDESVKKQIKDLRVSLDTDAKPRAITALINEQVDFIQKGNHQILRRFDDVYRQVVAETVSLVNTGVATRREATQQTLNKFARRGVASFIDKSGRSWDMASYAEMATRTAYNNAQLQGSSERLKENDHDLVITSSHPDSCEMCEPHQGEIFSLEGISNKYPALSSVTGEIFHPNCRHTYNAYFEGITKKPDKKADPQKYKDRQKQRYNERQIRNWKKREAVAITDKEKIKSKNKISQWQKAQRDHVKQTNLSRKYEREQVKGAR